MNLATKIIEIRKASGLTQKDFAEKLFVTRQAVTRWEKAETTPTLETLKTIIDLFKVDANVLFDSFSICQSCGRQLETADDFGLNKDKSVSAYYCNPCLTDGELYPINSFNEWVDLCLQYLDKSTEEEKEQYKQYLATLKRWKK